MNKSLVGALLQAAVLSGPAAMAQDSVLEHVLNACEQDLDAFCNDVTPGEGRILACLDEHDAEVGDTCRQAISDLVDD